MARPSECVGSHNAFHLYMPKASSSSTSSTKSSSVLAAISGSVHFLLFSLFLFIVPNSPPLLIPETFQLYSISPLIRVTMQFDAQIALSDNILHKMTQFNRRLCRGKFGPRFLIDFFVGSQSMTLFALILPFCLSPTFMVPILNVGASVKPLEEFPTTPSTNFKVDK